MADLQAIERELVVARKRDDNDVRVRLIPRALQLPDAQPHRAEYLDELGYAYQQLGLFDEAIDAMRQALAAGWDGELDDHPSAQALIADLLLHAGHTQQADDAWSQAEHEDPLDPRLHRAAGLAYADVGQHRKALAWLTKGLELALADGSDGDMIWLLTGERAETLDVLGQAPDALQLRAEERVERDEQAEQQRIDAFYHDRDAQTILPQRASVGLAWFPDGQYQRALVTWPSFAEDYQHGPYEAYCARLELLLRDLRARASHGSRSHRSRSTATSSGAPSTTVIPSSPTPAPATPPNSSNTTTGAPGHPNATNPAGAEAAANTRSAAYAPADPKTPKVERSVRRRYGVSDGEQ